jgi:microcystin-dependent protein
MKINSAALIKLSICLILCIIKSNSQLWDDDSFDNENNIFDEILNDKDSELNVLKYLEAETESITRSHTETKLPRGTVLMVASKQIDKWFTINGHGIGEYAGWYLCDGRNGSPNLNGRFPVGRELLKPDSVYFDIGNTGGTEYVKLKESNMPSHSHIFSATTSSSGAHAHFYKDLVYPDGCDVSIDMNRGVRSGTHNNRGCERTMVTENSGSHTHTVSGSTSISGSNEPHENRPPYYVLSFIIYIGK